MPIIKLALVDDHDIVRTGLKTFLNMQPDMQVVAEASSGEEAIIIARQENPDVILMDITMDGMDGLEATRKIKMISPNCRILALTVHADKQYFFEMLSAGAEGYVTKHAAAEDLVDAIRALSAGHVYLQPALARWLFDDYQQLIAQLSSQGHTGQYSQKPHPDLEVLTDRERQVLELVADGNNNQQIGDMLGISPKTVSRHRERIMRKLDLHSCAALVKFAFRTGLIDPNA
jgi:DNA-binding NarL/FixJ family response regulator